LQTGVGFAHCESTRHCTQVRDEALQIGVAPVHADPLVAEHWTHCPVTHAGAVGNGQLAVLPDPRSPLQGSHIPAAVLQTGAVLGQLALVVQ
jgi:hypothetical protein